MYTLPDEIINIILEYVITNNKYYTSKEIKNKKRDLTLTYLIFKEKKVELDKYRIIYKYINIYHIYQDDYNNYIKYSKKNNRTIREQIPLLVDLFNTGIILPCTYCSNNRFCEEILYEDIKNIIKLMPDAIHSTFGQMRCRTRVTPLYAAISNENVPVYMIEYLLKNGANKNLDIYVNGEKFNILDDYYFCNHVELHYESGNTYKYNRYNNIKRLIQKYK
jgi:hypothetical protein